jgi:hypothetical protein
MSTRRKNQPDPSAALAIIGLIIKNMSEVCEALRNKFPELDRDPQPSSAAPLAERLTPIRAQAIDTLGLLARLNTIRDDQ